MVKSRDKVGLNGNKGKEIDFRYSKIINCLSCRVALGFSDSEEATTKCLASDGGMSETKQMPISQRARRE